jgi:DNA-binding NtrC family response regulator
VEATRLGASDFLEKPVPYKKLLMTVEQALTSRPVSVAPPASLEWLGSSEVVRLLAQRLRQAASSGSTLLLTGEPGVGAEACARYLHNPSQPWLAPDDLSILAERPMDWLNQAKGGLLFLREVGKLAPLQQKGLQLLLNRRGEFGVTVICASTENLAKLAGEGLYSRDLYNTLAQVAVRIPPLREHREDIPALAMSALREVMSQQNLDECHFSEAALERLAKHDWRGNLDELRSVVHNLAVTALDTVIDKHEVEALLGNKIQPDAGVLSGLFGLPLKEARDAFEKAYLESVLAECNGSMTRVAERSGLERTHLYRKLKQLGVKSASRNDNH